MKTEYNPLSHHIVGPRAYLRNLSTNWARLSLEMGTAFFLTPFIIGQLGLAAYGIWSIANTVTGYLGLVDMGLRGSLGRFVNLYMGRGDKVRLDQVIATSAFILSVAGVVAILVAWLIGSNFPYLFPKAAGVIDDMHLVLPLLGVCIWFTFLRAEFRVIVTAHERFDLANLVDVSALIVRTVGVVIALITGWGLVGLALALVAGNIVGTCVMALAARRLNGSLALAPKYVSLERLREMWGFGVANFVTRSARQFTDSSDHLVVMWFLGPEALGIYSIATMLVQYVRKAIDQVGMTLFPSVMKVGGLEDFRSLRVLYRWKARLSLLIAALAAAGLGFLGDDFIYLWVGPRFSDAALVLTILAVTELLRQLDSCGAEVLFSLGRVRFNMAIAIGEAAINLMLSVIFVAVFHWGMAGVALGTLVAGILFRVILSPYYITGMIEYGYARYMRDTMIPLLGLSALGAALLGGLDWVGGDGWSIWAAKVFCAGLVYALLAPFLIFKPREMRDFWRKMFPVAPAQT